MSTFLTQAPLRASADINPCRILVRSGAYTAAQATNATTEPIGISAEFTYFPPIVDYGLSALHARGAQADPVSYASRGMKALCTVGAGGLAANVRVMSDANGQAITLVGGVGVWSVGFVLEAAPAGSKVEVFIDPMDHGT